MRIIPTSNVSDFVNMPNAVVFNDENNIFLSLKDNHSVLCITNGKVSYSAISQSFGTYLMDTIIRNNGLFELCNVNTVYVWDVSAFCTKDSEV